MGAIHTLVCHAPVYLLGLKAVIQQKSPDSEILTCRTPADISEILGRKRPGFLWWAIQPSGREHIAEMIAPVLNKFPKELVIVLQHGYSSEIVKACFDVGIAAFMSNMCASEEIGDAIVEVSRGRKYVDRRVASALSSSYLGPGSSPETIKKSLSDREKEVLNLIVNEYTSREIADKLYISICTVETHRLHLIRKLGVKNVAGLVRKAMVWELEGTDPSRPQLQF
jgi:DNA-binding NarL/FixJ family response regulator